MAANGCWAASIMTATPEVRVYSNRMELARAAAAEFAGQAQAAVSQRGRFLVCLAGGSTPLDTYRLLAAPPFSTELPWEHMFILWGDERMVPPTDPESNFGLAEQALLQHVPVRLDQVWRMRGELTPDQATADYASRLRLLADPGLAWPRFDLVLLGLGADGHIASLFPRQPASMETARPVIAVEAAYQNRPAQRLTLTPLVFNTARRVLILVAGEEKAAALKASLDLASDPHDWPARRVNPTAGRVTWLVDVTAAGKHIQ
jgi:6-phosphogluconolactonase